MNDLKPTTIIFILLGFAAILGVRFWAEGEAGAIRGPQHLVVSPDRTLYLQVDHQLVGLSNRDRLTRRYDVKQLSSNHFAGAFDFFSNGDLLFRRGTMELSGINGLLAFLRLPNQTDIAASSNEEGLARCNLKAMHCERFGDGSIDANQAHQILIDRRDDTVYLADTSRFVLYKFDSQGQLLAKQDRGFWFPNEMYLNDDGLWLVDTNYMAFKLLHTDTERFGKTVRMFSLRSRDAKYPTKEWPLAAIRVRSEWWAILLDNGMRDGVVYRFSEDGKPIAPLSLPVDADPIDLSLRDGVVYISDYSRFAVYRFDQDGDYLGNIDDPELTAILQPLKNKADIYRIISNAALVVFGFALVVGFAVAIWFEKYGPPKERRAQLTRTAVPPSRVSMKRQPSRPVAGNVVWTNADARSTLLRSFLAVATVIIGVALYVLQDVSLGEHFSMHAFSALSVVGLLSYVFFQFKRTRLGVSGRLLIIERGNRKEIGMGKEIVYSGNHVGIGNLIVYLGIPPFYFFDRKIVEEKIYPLLANARNVSPRELQDLVLNRPQARKFLWVMLFVVVALGILALAFAHIL